MRIPEHILSIVLILCLNITALPQMHAQSPMFFEGDLALVDPSKDKTKPLSRPELIKKKNTNLQVVKGMILVQASVNHKKGLFLLDTGAPSLIVNAYGRKHKNYIGAGACGNINGKWELQRHFKFEGIHLKKVVAISANIRNLELNAGKPLEGLIGYDLIKKYELFLDFRQNRFKLNKKKQSTFSSGGKPLLTIPFTLVGHMPVIKTKIGKRNFYLGVDTGASVNVLKTNKLRRVMDDLANDFTKTTLIGVGKTKLERKSAEIKVATIRKMDFHNMKFLFTDINLNNHPKFDLDGLLGFPFFEGSVISIDYTRNKIFIWKLPDCARNPSFAMEFE